MNIYEKLGFIQGKLKAPKSQYNKFGGYAYRNCEDILEAVKPLLMETATTLTITDELVLIGERYYIKATAKLIDCDTQTGVCIQNTAFAREEEIQKGKDGAQITGASSSYARKYALNGLFAIDDTKDSDTINTGDKDEKKETAKGLDPKLLDECKRLDIKLEKIATYLKKPVENLTNEDLQKCIDQKAKALGGAK